MEVVKITSDLAHLLASDDAFPSLLSSVTQFTKANLESLKNCSPKAEYHELCGSFLFARYKVEAQGLFYRYALEAY